MRESETLKLNIPEDGPEINRLVRYLAKEIERFRTRVFGKVLQKRGDEISYRTIHRWAQEEGKRLKDEEED